MRTNGFLGAFLLAELLERTQAHIYCLIRGENEADALDRLKRQIARFELTPRIDYRRIVPVCGNLAEPKLGICSKVYEEIAQNVDAIVHNGALVNFVQPYRSLKAANVLGTEEVLRLAGIGKAKAVHYISTLSVFSGRSPNAQGFSETDEPHITEQLRAGYPQSKWVAEKMVRTAAGRGFQITVYRPGTVAGDSRNGVWNTDDFLCRVLKGCVQLGFAPNENERLDMAPVDYISRAIVALSMLPQSSGSIFHLNHTHPPCSFELLNGFVAAGLSFDTIPYNDWASRLAGGATNIKDFALTPLLAQFQERREDARDGDDAEFDCRKTQAILEKLGVECPAIDGPLIKRYRDFFIRSGFLAMSE
ncbi:MAG: thioester reductase domain-containing protein [Gammaproteobacteria bacterium]